MKLSIPITGGSSCDICYDKNIETEINRFILINNLLNKYLHDSKFYIQNIKYLFNKLDYTDNLLNDCKIINNHLISILSVNNFELIIQKIINEFNISHPLINSIKYIIKGDDDIVNKMIKYIKDNNVHIKLSIILKNKNLYKTQYEKLNKTIKHCDKKNNIESIIKCVSHNISEYIKILNLLNPFILNLEDYYVNLSQELYKLRN